MTRQACLGRKGLSGLTLRPYVTPSGGSVGAELSSPPQLEGEEEAWRLGVPVPGPGGEEEEGGGSTWSLAAFLGQDRERKYMKRVAPGLAIWAEMPAASVGV